MSQPKIEITITGRPRVGTTSLAWLLSDFLQHTGFNVEINSADLDDNFMVKYLQTIPERLETIMDNDTVIVINDRISATPEETV